MADSKITALTALTTVAGEDLVAIVDDPSGTPVSKKATIDQIKTYIGGTKVRISTDFSNSARFSLTSVTSGETLFGSSGVFIGTGGTTGASQTVDYKLSTVGGFKAFDNNPSFTASIGVDNIGSNEASFFIGIGDLTTASTGITFTGNHIGFKIITVSGVATLYATQADGTTETVSSALTTLTNNKSLELIVDVTSGTSATYYYRYNGGATSAGTTLTTNIASGNGNKITVSLSNDNTSTQQQFYVSSMEYAR